MNRRDFFKTTILSLLSVPLGRFIPSAFDTITYKDFVECVKILEADRVLSYSWKWYGGYARLSDSMIALPDEWDKGLYGENNSKDR
jgi:hypothetical protein